MLGNVSPLRPNPREDGVNRSDRTKPQEKPRTDDFRKSMRDRPPPKKSVEDQEEPPSPFELSKAKKQTKTSTPSKSDLKDPGSSNFATDRPVTEKQGRDQEQGQSEDSGYTDTSETVSDDMLQSPEEALTSPEQEGLKKPGEDPSLKQPKQPLQQPLDGLKPENAALLQRGKLTKEESSFETDKAGPAPKKLKSGKGEETKSSSDAEVKEGAAAGVNPSIQSIQFQSEKTQEAQETIQSATIKDIANQIVDRIQVMRKGNETQTIITLRHPPILEGATITLTASDNAKREFNIRFANLSPDAKLLLDRKLKEDSLTETLERRGITVNVLTTTTQSESIMTQDAGQASRDRQDQQQQQQEQQQRRGKGFQSPEEEEGAP